MTQSSRGHVLYVAVDGRDSWSGTRPSPGADDGPFVTLERARDEIRRLKERGELEPGGITEERVGRPVSRPPPR